MGNHRSSLLKKKIINTHIDDVFLFETAWEVCNQVGGIYTVVRSKVPTMTQKWGDNYCLIGPYVHAQAKSEFEASDDLHPMLMEAVKTMRQMGLEVHAGRWAVTGRPQVILVNPESAFSRLGDIRYFLWEHHRIPTTTNDDLVNRVLAFGHLIKVFLGEASRANNKQNHLIAHIHEWMAGSGIPDMRHDGIDVSIVFTTHATILGRYLAMHSDAFYTHLSKYDWGKEAKHFNIECQASLERAAAHGAHVFTTVSEVTGQECIYLLGREPDVILPNGLNIERFDAAHEFQNLHKKNKQKTHEFTMGHFFPSYSFDLDKTLYFFTSGRFEYKNKGFDLCIEALSRLNRRMHEDNVDMNVVMFFISKRPVSSVRPQVLQSRAMLEKIREICDEIQRQVGERFFNNVTTSANQGLSNLGDYVDDYWKLSLKRTLQAWRTGEYPSICTHYLHDNNDEIINYLCTKNLVNAPYDKVKVVYHPDFISPISPIQHMDYNQFVRGCHLGVFPSYYEPWGYTPLECIALGVPAVTSDLSGFGAYLTRAIPENERRGIFVSNRSMQSYDESANELAEYLLNFVKQTRRERISGRNRVEQLSSRFDWSHLVRHYDRAYSIALQRRQT